MRKSEQREMNCENSHDKEELRSVGIANREIGREVTPLSSGELMGERGNSQWENRWGGTTCVDKGIDGNSGDVSGLDACLLIAGHQRCSKRWMVWGEGKLRCLIGPKVGRFMIVGEDWLPKLISEICEGVGEQPEAFFLWIEV